MSVLESHSFRTHRALPRRDDGVPRRAKTGAAELLPHSLWGILPAFLPAVNPKKGGGYLKSDVGFFCFTVFEKGDCSKVFCGVFSFRAVRGKAVAVKFYVGFLIKSGLCKKRHRHLTEDAGVFLLECSGNQLNNSSSFCWSVPSLAYGSASNCRKLCLMSFVSSLKPRMYESAM